MDLSSVKKLFKKELYDKLFYRKLKEDIKIEKDLNSLHKQIFKKIY